MIATTHSVLLASFLASAGLFAAYDGVALPKNEVAATFSERFPRQDEMFKSVVRVSAGQQGPQVTTNKACKGDKIVGDKIVALGEFCAEQQWPYIAPECLQRTDGAAMRWPTRTITIEHRTGDNSSTLVRTPMETLALR